MKKKVSICFIISLMLVFSLAFTKKSEASISNIPYPTYSFGLRGQLINTATAYEGTFILNAGLKDPQDIFIDIEDNVYIADAAFGNVYKYNPKTKQGGYLFPEFTLEYPTGVYVDKNLDIYIADKNLNQVLWFDKDLNLVRTYDKPDEPLFGENTEYKPLKVLVDAKKNVYVISEGGSNGIIQMDENGDFLGFYGVNKVDLNFSLRFRRLLMSKEERATLADLAPKANTNFAIDHQGLIYTVIENELENSIKKLNIQGVNKLTGRTLNDPYYQDIFVGADGLIYSVTSNKEAKAVVSIHDSQGNLIFAFGDIKDTSFKVGEFGLPSGIAADSNGDIWVLDSTGRNVQVFTKTEFASMVISAIKYYNDSEYEKAEELFKEVVRQNAMFSLAHSNLGKLYQRNNEFELALESYKIANNRNGYSEVFWELRDEWIAKNLPLAIVLIVVLFISIKIFNKQKNKYEWYNKLTKKITIFKSKKIYHELNLLKRILKDPIDVVYEIKFRQSVRIKTAVSLFVIFIFLNIICDFFIKGYLFRGNTTEVVLTYEIMKWFIPLFLLGVANHLINALQSGEGFYRDIFIGIIYALAPILMFKLPLDILSNVLTYNEGFIYQLAYLIMYGWSIFNIIIVIKEINNYKPFQLVINLILTVFTMLIMIILYLVISVLTNQLWTFIEGILQEVFS